MSAATKVRKPQRKATTPPIAAPPPAPDLEAIRDALNDIDLKVSRIRAVASTLSEDFYESVASGHPNTDPFSEIFLVYCDSLTQAAADIGACTERAFSAAAGKAAVA